MIRKLSTALASLAVLAAPVAVAMANPTPAPARVPAPCVIQLGNGGTAPCPPPIVSTDGSSIGGGANTDPVNMGDLPRTGPDYSYEAPTWTPAEEEPDTEEPTETEEPAPGSGQ
ncbi:hypothetical protein [Gordonia rubripertincta]|uniref:hypothetical protein n=1 Tax=Gordonia rubripertincta TaxID=36822 RepID=UPI0015FA218D|nr:hypothetical protein [Gordonia rubripertincta]QMU22049.1 hypothetical protein H3V45_06040 [Gordonia rubripertincta]